MRGFFCAEEVRSRLWAAATIVGLVVFTLQVWYIRCRGPMMSKGRCYPVLSCHSFSHWPALAPKAAICLLSYSILMSDDVENFITQWLLRFHGILKALGQVKELVKFARCERLIQSPLVLEIHA